MKPAWKIYIAILLFLILFFISFKESFSDIDMSRQQISELNNQLSSQLSNQTQINSKLSEQITSQSSNQNQIISQLSSRLDKVETSFVQMDSTITKHSTIFSILLTILNKTMNLLYKFVELLKNIFNNIPASIIKYYDDYLNNMSKIQVTEEEINKFKTNVLTNFTTFSSDARDATKDYNNFMKALG